ncbi:hypothetical protein D3C86_1876110 [compost metagenome]
MCAERQWKTGRRASGDDQSTDLARGKTGFHYRAAPGHNLGRAIVDFHFGTHSVSLQCNLIRPIGPQVRHKRITAGIGAHSGGIGDADSGDIRNFDQSGRFAQVRTQFEAVGVEQNRTTGIE